MNNRGSFFVSDEDFDYFKKIKLKEEEEEEKKKKKKPRKFPKYLVPGTHDRFPKYLSPEIPEEVSKAEELIKSLEDIKRRDFFDSKSLDRNKNNSTDSLTKQLNELANIRKEKDLLTRQLSDLADEKEAIYAEGKFDIAEAHKMSNEYKIEQERLEQDPFAQKHADNLLRKIEINAGLREAQEGIKELDELREKVVDKLKEYKNFNKEFEDKQLFQEGEAQGDTGGQFSEFSQYLRKDTKKDDVLSQDDTGEQFSEFSQYLRKKQPEIQGQQQRPKELEKYLNMSREEFLALPFQERADASKLIGNRNFLTIKNDEDYVSPFVGTKANISTATLGFSENLPGLSLSKKERESMTLNDKLSEFAVGFLPINIAVKWISNPFTRMGLRWAAGTKNGAGIIKGFGALTGSFATGAAVEGVKEVGKGEFPSAEKMAEEGTLWLLIHAGLSGLGKIGSFAKSLIRIARNQNKSSGKVLSQVVDGLKRQGVTDASDAVKVAASAEKILSGLESKGSKSLIKGSKPLKDRSIDQINKPLVVEDPSMFAEDLPKNLDIRETTKLKEKVFPKEVLDSVSKRTDTKLDLGNNIQSGIKAEMAKDKAVYDPLYNFAREIAGEVEGVPKGPLKQIDETRRFIASDMKANPGKHASTISMLDKAEKDLGRLMTEEGVQVQENISVKKMIDLHKRLNEFIDHGTVDWNITQSLIKLNKLLSTTIEETLSKHGEAGNAWRAAETKFAESARKFRSKNMRKIRSDTKPERLANEIESPTILKDLKKALPSETYAQVEREILEKVNRSNLAKAEEYSRELSKSVSPETDKIMKEIVETKRKNELISEANKNPGMTKKKKDLIRSNIVEELFEASETGKRPSKALDLWKTKQGNKLVLDAIKGNKKRAEVIEYLNDQSLSDVVESLTNKDGVIDYRKINKLVRDSDYVDMLKRITRNDKDAVDFFRQLEHRGKQLENNLIRLSKMQEGTKGFKEGVVQKGVAPIGENVIARKNVKNTPFDKKLNNALKELGFNSYYKIKHLLYALVGSALSLKVVSGIVVSKFLLSALKKPSVRNAFKQASSKSVSNSQMISSMRIIEKALEEEEDLD